MHLHRRILAVTASLSPRPCFNTVSRSAPHATPLASLIEPTRISVLSTETHLAVDVFNVPKNFNALDPKSLPPITGHPPEPSKRPIVSLRFVMTHLLERRHSK